MSSRWPCPCCGYRTLPTRGDYEVCPVCDWEDDGAPPWSLGGPNGISLIEAQQRYLRFGATHKDSRKRVRRARPDEARDPDWQPYDPTDEAIVSEMERERIRVRLQAEADDVSAASYFNGGEDPLVQFNDAVQQLRAKAGGLTLVEVETQYRDLCDRHGLGFGSAEIEFMSRLIKDKRWPIRHPIDSLAWSWRHRGSATWLRRLNELRTRSMRFVG